MRNDQPGVYIDSDARRGCDRDASCSQHRCNAPCGHHHDASCPAPAPCGHHHDASCPAPAPCGYAEPCAQRRPDAPCAACGRHHHGAPCAAPAAAACGCAEPCGKHRPDAPGPRRTPAMVYAAGHTADEPYSCEQALVRGTLFPCLDKPLCGEGRCGAACISEAQQLNFAAWELRLYLNTHPGDCEALRQLRRICQQLRENGYACAFLSDCSQAWTWTDAPWPWEFDACCGKEG